LIWRYREAKRPGGFEVDDQLNFCRLFDRQISRLCTVKDFSGADGRLFIARARACA